LEESIMSKPTKIAFNASVVEASEAGDFIQILFSASDDDESEYLMFQTQFEFPQDYDFQIETKDGKANMELSETVATLHRNHLEITGVESQEQILLTIDFETSDRRFAAMRKTLKSMVGKLII